MMMNDTINNFYDIINNCDKDGLLNHNISGNDRYNDNYNQVRLSGNFNYFNNYNNVNNLNHNYNNYTNISNSSTSYNENSSIRKRKSAMKNYETEIFYDIFNVDPDQNLLPEQ